MRPISYLEEATEHVNRINNGTFFFAKVEEDSPEFRELVFAAASFAVMNSIAEGRTFIKDPEISSVIGELTDYSATTKVMRKRTEGQSDAS